MDIQHSMAVKIANMIDKETPAQDEEKIMLTYGVEVFLNEFLKMLCAWSLAIIFGIFPSVFYGTVFLLILRRYAGGIHFRSNAVCFVFTVMVLVAIPIAARHIVMPQALEMTLILCEIILFAVFAPAHAKKEYTVKEKAITKIILILFHLIGIYGAKLLQGENSKEAMIMIAFVAAVTAIERKNPC